MVTLSSTKEARIDTGKKITSLTSGVGKIGHETRTLSNTIHINKLKMDKRSKCKTRNPGHF